MENPKTTVSGYAVIACALIYLCVQLYYHELTFEQFLGLTGLLATGGGLVGASDGGH